MRLSLVPVAVALLAVSACGSGGSTTDSLSPAAAVRAAADKGTTGSSKLDLKITTTSAGADVTFDGTGAFAYSGSDVTGSMVLTVGSRSIDEKITGGYLYLQVPGQPYYKLKLDDLVGTSLAGSSNPGSAAELLAAIGDSATKVGTETIKGEKTTHYRGEISLADATAKVKGAFAKAAVQKLVESGVRKIPVDVYLDSMGRLRRLTEDVSLTAQGALNKVVTQIDFYDFGTTVSVTPPPADQVKDGASFLKQLKGAVG
jgi:hypothetical protein